MSLVGGIRASPTMGSPFLAKIRILKDMYPAHPNGNRYSLRKPYLSALSCMLVHSALHRGRGWGAMISLIWSCGLRTMAVEKASLKAAPK